MSYNYKISDLKFHIDKLVPKDVCKYFIDFYENNKQYALPEKSYKYEEKISKHDNYKCINLHHEYLKNKDKKFIEPLELAKRYVSIMITNYVVYLKQNISPSFDNNLIKNSNNIRIMKYDVGQYIADHSDVEGEIRASCTLNLNEDYKGGEFRFFDGKIKHTFKTGDAMIFPAEPIWIHGTEPITKGARYSINCFLKR